MQPSGTSVSPDATAQIRAGPQGSRGNELVTECQVSSELGWAVRVLRAFLLQQHALPLLQASVDTFPVETSCARSPGAQIVHLSAAEVIAEPAVPALLAWDMSVGA